MVHDDCTGQQPGRLSLELLDDIPNIQLAVLDLSDSSSGWDHDYAEVVEPGLPPRWLDASYFLLMQLVLP